MIDATNAEGSARKENEIYMEHLQSKINVLKASIQELSGTVLSSDALAGLLDTANNFVNVLEFIVEKLGTIPTLLLAINTAIAFKSGGNLYIEFYEMLKRIPTSLGNLKSSLSQINSLFKNPNIGFTGISAIGKDSKAIKEYYSLLSKGVSESVASNQALVGTSTKVNKTLLSGCSDLTQAQTELAKAYGITEKQMIACETAGIATSIAISAGISVAIAGLSKIYETFKGYYFDRAARDMEAYEKALGSYEKTKANSDTLDELITKYKQVASSEYLSGDAKSQALEIQQQIVDLVGDEVSGYNLVNGTLQERLNILDQIQAKQLEIEYNEARKTLETSRKAEDSYVVGEEYSFWNDLQGKTTGTNTVYNVGSLFTDTNLINNLKENDALNYLETKNGTLNTYDNKLRIQGTTNQKINQLNTYIKAFEDAIEDTNDKFKQEEYQDAIDSFENIIIELEDLQYKTKQDALNYVSTSLETVISKSDILKNVELNNSNDYIEYRQQLLDVLRRDSEVQASLKHGDIRWNNLYNIVDTYMQSQDKFNRAYTDWAIHNVDENINKLDFIKSKFDNGGYFNYYKNGRPVEAKEIRQEFNDWLNILDKEDLDYVYKISLDTESAYYDLEEWQKQLEYARNGKYQNEASIKDFYNVFANTSDEGFSATLDAYQSQLSTYQDIITKFNSGELSDSDINDLIRQYPTLINYIDDLDKGVNELIDSSKSNIIEKFNEQIEELGKDSTGGKMMAQLRDRIIEVTDAAKDGIVLNIDVEKTFFDNIGKALNESVSGSGISSSTVKSMTNIFKDVEGFDVSELFEKTSNGIHLNINALQDLQDEYIKTKRADTQKDLDEKIDKYNKLTKQINKTSDMMERANLVSEQNKLKEEIEDVAALIVEYDGLTSAYNNWLRAKETDNEGSMYDTIHSGIEETKELYDADKIGTDDFKEYVKLVSGEDLTNASAQEYKEAWENIQKQLKRYSTEDSRGVINFLKDVNKLDSSLAYLDNKGNWQIDFDDKSISKISKELGLSKEYIEAIVLKSQDFGMELDISGITDDLKLVENYLTTCNNKLIKLGLTEIKFDFSDTNLETLDAQIEEAIKLYNGANFIDDTGNFNIQIEGADEARTILKNLLLQRQQITYSNLTLMKIDTSTLKNDVKDVITYLQNIKRYNDEIELGRILKIDTSESEEKLNELLELIQYTNPTLKEALNLDTSNLNNLLYSIEKISPEILAKIGVDTTDLDKMKDENETIEADVVFNISDEVVLKFIKKIQEVINGTIHYDVDVDDSEVDALERRLAKTTNSATYKKTVTTYKNNNGSISQKITTPHGSITQSTMADGTAYAQGSWGTKSNGIALGGELGAEIRVRDGKWELIGEKGAEFFKYKKNDIIFNAQQTKNILKYGKLTNGKTRGRALVGGTAFNNGMQSVVGNGGLSNNLYNKTDTSEKAKSDKKSTEKTALEKFQDWFSKLFDWIEIKLERQADKIQKYVDQAQYSLDSNNYSTAISNYKNALNSTNTQISYQSQAASKYNTQANNILSKAISMGTITQKQANIIKNGVKNGAMNISEYSDAIREVISSYQTWYEKSKEASDSIKELRYNIRDYIRDLKEVADAQRDATIDKISQRQEIGTSFGTYSLSAKTNNLSYQNSILKEQHNAYATAVDVARNEVTVGVKGSVSNTANSSINSALKTNTAQKTSAYKKALQTAQTCIKNKKKISSSVLTTISKYNSSVYNYCYAYNFAIDNYELSKLEEAVNYAAYSSDYYNNKFEVYENYKNAYDDKISLYNDKSNNAMSTSSKNSFLDSVVKQYDNIVAVDSNAIKSAQSTITASTKEITGNGRTIRGYGYSGLSTAGKNNVNTLISNILSKVKSGSSIPASYIDKLATYYSKGYINASYYTACINYNNALAKKEEYEAQLEIDKQTAIAEKASIGTQKLDNITQEWENKINANDSETTRISNLQAVRTTKGASLTASDYQALIKQNEQKQTLLNNMVTQLNSQISQNLEDGLWTTSSQEYIDAIQAVNDYSNQVIEILEQQQELNNSLQTLDITNLEKAISLLERYHSYLESITSLMEAQSKTISASEYQKQVNNNLAQISEAEKQAASAWQKYLIATNDADKAYAGKSADEWKEYYYETLANINSLKSSNEELYDSIWQTYIQPFDEAIEKLENYTSLLESTSNLLNSNDYIGKDGTFANDGLAQISAYLESINMARKQIQEYQNAINELNKMYSDGTAGLSEKEYNEKLQEYQNGLLDIASQEKSVINDLLNMWINASQVELDNLNKIIEARKSALQSKKDYYDYDKNIKSQTKDIQALTSQIAALEGVEDAESKALKTRLEAQRAEAQESLDETIQEHLYNIKIEGLDELQTTLQENYENYVDELQRNYEKMTEVLSNSSTLISDSYFSIMQAFQEVFNYLGIDMGYIPIDGYASGTTNVNKDKIAWTQEDGREIIVRKSDGAILTPLSQGDGVIPNNLTENLFEWGKNTPSDFINKMGVSSMNITPIDSAITPNVNIQYGNLLNVEGNVDRDALPPLQKILEKSYDYTKQQIVRDARKGGLKP